MADGYEDPYDSRRPIVVSMPRENGAGRFNKLLDGLLLLAVVGLVGLTWNLSINVAELRRDFANLKDQFTALATTVNANKRGAL